MTHTLIGQSELRETLDGSVIFDCRFSLLDHSLGRQQFLESHIPGAHHLDMESDLAGEKTGRNGRHPLPDAADFQRVLRAAGVNNDSTIVLYDANRLAGAARAWWLLRYFGRRNVRVLDGGLVEWQKAGFPTECGEVEPSRRGDVVLQGPTESMIVNRAAVLAAARARSSVIVDAREPARFAGSEEPIDPVAGRIPGARNIPWPNVTDDDGFVAARDVLHGMWQAANAGEDPIVYCGSGVTASVLLLARHLAGLTGGRLYPGSWSEWCAQEDCPVERDELM